MEVSTKERLTGALIAVVALVGIAPELLTGRHAPDRSTPRAQDPEDGPPLQTYSIQLNASGTAPVASLDVPAVAAAELAATANPQQAADQAAGRSAPAGASGSTAAAAGKWWVQVGSFESRANAQRLAQQLRGAGFTVDMSQNRQNGKDVFRVRAGPVADREAAKALQARLTAAGQKKHALVAP